MEKAKESVNRPSLLPASQLEKYREMLWQMEMDRLIDMGNDFTIEFREGALLIDGHVQPPSVLEKFRKYFREENENIYKKKPVPVFSQVRFI
jgi:hypothetical protein